MPDASTSPPPAVIGMPSMSLGLSSAASRKTTNISQGIGVEPFYACQIGGDAYEYSQHRADENKEVIPHPDIQPARH